MLYFSESAGNPILTSLGVDPALGNMEGKDSRFSQAQASLFAAATTGTGTGAANATYVFDDADRRRRRTCSSC